MHNNIFASQHNPGIWNRLALPTRRPLNPLDSRLASTHQQPARPFHSRITLRTPPGSCVLRCTAPRPRPPRAPLSTNGERVGNYHHKLEGGKDVSAVVIPPQAHRELQGKQNKTRPSQFSAPSSMCTRHPLHCSQLPNHAADVILPPFQQQGERHWASTSASSSILSGSAGLNA